EEVRLQLDRREARRASREAHEAAVAAGRVGEADDRARVQVAVRREMALPEVELRPRAAASRLEHADAQQAGEAGRAALAERLQVHDPNSMITRDEGADLRGRHGDEARRADACDEQAPAPGRALADGLLPAAAPAAPRRARRAPRHRPAARRRL